MVYISRRWTALERSDLKKMDISRTALMTAHRVPEAPLIAARMVTVGAVNPEELHAVAWLRGSMAINIFTIEE